MDLEISIDFEANELSIIVDNTVNITAIKEADGTTTYRKLSRLPEEQQEKFQKIVALLFSLEDTV